MNQQRRLHIQLLSTEDLLAHIKKTKYEPLSSIIKQLCLTGNDLLNMSEFEINVKLGMGNPSLKLFKSLWDAVRTTPNAVFQLESSAERRSSFRNSTSQSSGISSMKDHSLTISQPRSRVFEIQKALGTGGVRVILEEKPKILVPKPACVPTLAGGKCPSANKTTEVYDTAQGINVDQKMRMLVPNQGFRKGSNISLNCKAEQAEASSVENLPEYINTGVSNISGKGRPSIKRRDEILVPDEDCRGTYDVPSTKQTSSTDELPEYSNTSDFSQNQTFTRSSNVFSGSETQASSYLKDKIPEYDNASVVKNENIKKPKNEMSSVSSSPSRNLPNVSTYKTLEEEMPEYINTPLRNDMRPSSVNSQPEYTITGSDSNRSEENPYPKLLNVLNNPRDRQKLEAALAKALKEMEEAEANQSRVYSNLEETQGVSSNDESVDSFASEEEGTPAAASQPLEPKPPVLPHRPPYLFPSEIRRIKVKNSTQPRDSINERPTLSRGSPSIQVNEEAMTFGAKPPPPSDKTCRPLPVIDLNAADLPVGVAIPDDNAYEEPVMLTSPQYAIRTIKFFREVTREQGAKMLEKKPIGTFILRPSTKYLAVLQFRGRTMINNVPLCHSSTTGEYYLASQPGAESADKFPNMLLLLRHYTTHSATAANDILISLDENNIE